MIIYKVVLIVNKSLIGGLKWIKKMSIIKAPQRICKSVSSNVMALLV